MAFIKSLATGGLIVAVASPAAAVTVTDYQAWMAKLRSSIETYIAAPQPEAVAAGQIVSAKPANGKPASDKAIRAKPTSFKPASIQPLPAAYIAEPVSVQSVQAIVKQTVRGAAKNAVATLLNLGNLRADLSQQVLASTAIATAQGTNKTAITPIAVNLPATPAPSPDRTADAGTEFGGIGPAIDDEAGDSGTIYYIDFASGNDANSGTSSAQPWKRAPGDPLATATAPAAKLVAGDTVRFRGGVSYRGSIEFKFSGEPDAPITYSGAGFGTGNAIIDGADAATSSVACPSQAACGNAPNWTSLRLVTFPNPKTTYQKLYDALGPLSEAFVPSGVDSFFGDDIDNFAVTPKANAAAIAAGRLENAQLAAAAQGQPNARVALWVQPNKVVERKIFSVSGSTIYFDNTDIKPYTDRDGRAAIVGSVKGLTRQGAYAVLGEGKAAVFPRSGGGTQYFIGTGRSGIDLNGAENVRVSGFRFLRATSAAGAVREGIAITNIGPAPSNVVIENNVFGPLSLRTGYGAINLNDGKNIVIRGNRFNDLQWASGIRLGGGIIDALIEGNRLSRGGRTGIYLQDTTNAVVRGNIVSGYESQHGNAMSVYQANRNVSVTGNCVFNSRRPLTFHGDSDSVQPNDIRITGNILIATADASAAVHSWGNRTRSVTISGNLLLGPKFGAILSSQDIGLTVIGNRTSGITQSGGAQPGDWVVSRNDVFDYATGRNAASLSIDRCSAAGPSGTITVTPL